MKKLLKNKKLLIGSAILLFIVIIAIVLIVNLGNSPEKNIKKYCDSIVKGTYRDIIDIAYIPDSEFITKDKIEKEKQIYFENMSKENNITSCEYSKANETDEKITYKLTINGDSTKNIDVDKKTNKIILDGIYETKTIETFVDSKVTIDGKEVKDVSKQDDKFIYKAIILSNVDYKIKVTPKNGVSEEIISQYIKEEEKDAKLTLLDRKTDLENGTDTISYSRELDNGILKLNEKFDLIFKFNSLNNWEYSTKEEKELTKNWNLNGGVWKGEDGETELTLELSQNGNEITGTYTWKLGTRKVQTYTSGKITDIDSSKSEIEFKGTETTYFVTSGKQFGNAKDVTTTFSITNNGLTISVPTDGLTTWASTYQLKKVN